MHIVQLSLLKILSDVLWGKTEKHFHTELEWDAILSQAEEQGILFLILQGCSGIRKQISSANWLKWRSKLVSTMVNNDSLMRIQSDLIRILEENGIPCAVLKGSSLATCYYSPAVRAMGDIDLLVAPHCVDQVVNMLLAEGFTAPKESFNHPYHIDFYRNGFVVELHFAVSTFPDSKGGREAKQFFEDCLDTVQRNNIGSHTFPCLAAPHQALHLLLHMERHMTTGCIGLRQLCDWAVFLNSITPAYFVSQILPVLEHCGLSKFAEVLSITSVCYLGLDPSYTAWCKAVNKDVSKDMIEEVLRAGSVHNKNNIDDISAFFVEANGTELPLIVFIKKMNSLAFRKFPITQRIQILLPMYWIYIPIRYWIRSLIGKRRRKYLMRTIIITKQRKKLYRELNLFQTDPVKKR